MKKLILPIIIVVAVVIVALILVLSQSDSDANQNNIINSNNDNINKNDSMEEGDVKTFNITGENFSFSESEIRVKKGDKVKIVFTSTQGTHDWVVDEFNAATSIISTGETSEVEFVANKAGTFEYYCSVGNHRQLGMVGNLIVE